MLYRKWGIGVKNVNKPLSGGVLGILSLGVVRWICWGVVIAIVLIWMTAQQIKINDYKAELAELSEAEMNNQERISELETMDEVYLSDEYIEREARKRGFVHPDDVIFKEAD